MLAPAAWRDLFQSIDPAYQLERVDDRYGDAARQVAVIVKGRPRARHFDLGKPIPGRDEVTRYFASRYPAESILDIGCGSLPLWPIFTRAGTRVAGIDLLSSRRTSAVRRIRASTATRRPGSSNCLSTGSDQLAGEAGIISARKSTSSTW